MDQMLHAAIAFGKLIFSILKAHGDVVLGWALGLWSAGIELGGKTARSSGA